MGAFRRILVWIFQRIFGVYFRDIEVMGEVPPGDVRGRLFVSNHVNGIIDPILVMITAGCEISPVAKSTLWKVPGFNLLLWAVDAVQIVRRTDDPGKVGGLNNGVFDHVADWLNRGGNILIFPEGTSHNEPHLVELKTGAARMLQRAVERRGRSSGNGELTFQSVALSFDAREQFRSRALVIYGPVRSVGDFQEKGEAFVGAFTSKVRKDLTDMLVEGASWEEFRLIARVAELLSHSEGDPTLSGWNVIGRRVEQAKQALLSAPDVIDNVRARVDLYYSQLDKLGLTDAQLVLPRTGTWRSGLSKVGAVCLTPLALVGYTFYLLPYVTVAMIAKRVKSGDEISTIKLGAGLLIFPLWALILMVCTPAVVSGKAAGGLVLVELLVPFIALWWKDQLPLILADWQAVFDRGSVQAAKESRIQAMESIEAARAQLQNFEG
ncbi:MAG: 1-acyl-sn-glycerol-3-phosphate acyltransferase [Polyangiaceae bacterium]|nr:1-acyl-sn-glycerol-3-phosphate acyltransferase [Polyangiaceae bacterium]